ncbi:MAG: LysE family translocator [Hyphomicrobiales bacterium]
MYDTLSQFSYLVPFVVATLIFGCIPGPSIMYTMAQTVARGRKGGLQAAFGIHVGCFSHIIAAALGLSAIFSLVPELYLTVKFIGITYLIYLGVRMIISKPVSQEHSEHTQNTTKTTFLSSALVEILNPKTAIFYIAFLPQFIDTSASWPVWLQFIVLGQIINIIFSTADIMYIFLAGYIIKKFKKNGQSGKILNWLGGSMLIGLASHLAFED